MVNIAEILKDCPEGTKLWSPVCGNCRLVTVDFENPYPIKVSYTTTTSVSRSLDYFLADGRFFDALGAECVLWPSKEHQSWEDFQTINVSYKPGEFIFVKTGLDWLCIFKGICENHIETYISYDPEDKELYGLDKKTNYLCRVEDIQDTRLATEQEKVEVLQALDKKGYFWDAENLKLVKKAWEFKPFDKVLVRDGNSQEWRADIFSHKSNRLSLYPYVTAGAIWKQCIPYEGNEHLVGTTNSPD